MIFLLIIYYIILDIFYFCIALCQHHGDTVVNTFSYILHCVCVRGREFLWVYLNIPSQRDTSPISPEQFMSFPKTSIKDGVLSDDIPCINRIMCHNLLSWQ